MPPTDPTWNFADAASRPRVLDVLRHEMDAVFGLVDDPDRWEAPTACELWQVRDVVGHLVDTTEGYLTAFGLARTGGEAPAPYGLRAMAARADEMAKALRKVPHEELVARLRDDAARMLEVFEALTDEEWTGFAVGHAYMGPLPPMFYAMFQIVDYTVHGWDIREGIGRPHGLSGDAADLLVPVIHILLQATADTSGVGAPFSIGVRTSGHNASDTRFDVSPARVQSGPGDVGDCAAVLEFDPASYVLTGYARINGGTVRGDPEAAATFRSMIFPI